MAADTKGTQPITKCFDFPKLSERRDESDDKEIKDLAIADTQKVLAKNKRPFRYGLKRYEMVLH